MVSHDLRWHATTPPKGRLCCICRAGTATPCFPSRTVPAHLPHGEPRHQEIHFSAG
jgi:hypothetical protein